MDDNNSLTEIEEHESTEAQDMESFDDGAPPEEPEEKDGADLLTELPPEMSLRPASLQERFAAFFVDALIYLYLLGGWAVVFKYITKDDPAHPFSLHKVGWLFFGSTAVALHFMYYFFFEGVLTTTPGKMLEGLSIQKKRGGAPSLFSILIRNLFRIIDYPFFFITGIGLIEATKRRQRLGDLVANTVVLRSTPFEGKRIDIAKAGLGSATLRTLAFLLDLPLIVAFFYGLLLAIPSQRSVVSFVCLNFVPLLTLLYVVVSEKFFQTTFGKAVFGLKITQEDGRPARFSSLMVQNAFRLIDMSPIGYLCAALSSRKQRPGDITAGTLVIRDRKGLRGWLSVPYMLGLAVILAMVGLHNPNSFVRKGYLVKAGDFQFDPIPAPVERFLFKGFRIEKLELGFNEDEVNKKGIYDPGNVIYLLFTISGYQPKDNLAWIQADVKVRDSKHNTVLDMPNLINASLPVEKNKSARMVARFALNLQAAPGLYDVTLTVKDLFGHGKVEEQRTFVVRK
jgi:uncharacterized RDD family membrane protein YckC